MADGRDAAIMCGGVDKQVRSPKRLDELIQHFDSLWIGGCVRRQAVGGVVKKVGAGGFQAAGCAGHWMAADKGYIGGKQFLCPAHDTILGAGCIGDDGSSTQERRDFTKKLMNGQRWRGEHNNVRVLKSSRQRLAGVVYRS